MIQKIHHHTVTRYTLRTLKLMLTGVLFILLPFVVLTFLTSNTSLIPGIQSYVVVSGSMEPAVPVGSIVYSKAESAYRPGDIISFTGGSGQIITHRLSQVTPDGFLTKGDANTAYDETLVHKDAVIGKTVLTVPYVGKLISHMKTPQGFVMFIIVPSVLFILSELWVIKKEFEKHIEKKVLKRLEDQNRLSL